MLLIYHRLTHIKMITKSCILEIICFIVILRDNFFKDWFGWSLISIDNKRLLLLFVWLFEVEFFDVSSNLCPLQEYAKIDWASDREDDQRCTTKSENDDYILARNWPIFCPQLVIRLIETKDEDGMDLRHIMHFWYNAFIESTRNNHKHLFILRYAQKVNT